MVLRVEIYSSSLLVNTSDVDECLAWTFDCEDESQMCENTYGSYKCVCAEGLYWIDGKCKGEISILLRCIVNHCARTKPYLSHKRWYPVPATFLPPLLEVKIENNIQTCLRYS